MRPLSVKPLTGGMVFRPERVGVPTPLAPKTSTTAEWDGAVKASMALPGDGYGVQAKTAGAAGNSITFEVEVAVP